MGSKESAITFEGERPLGADGNFKRIQLPSIQSVHFGFPHRLRNSQSTGSLHHEKGRLNLQATASFIQSSLVSLAPETSANPKHLRLFDPSFHGSTSAQASPLSSYEGRRLDPSRDGLRRALTLMSCILFCFRSKKGINHDVEPNISAAAGYVKSYVAARGQGLQQKCIHIPMANGQQLH